MTECILTWRSWRVNFLCKRVSGTTDECWKWHRVGESALQTNRNPALHLTAGILWRHQDIPAYLAGTYKHTLPICQHRRLVCYTLPAWWQQDCQWGMKHGLPLAGVACSVIDWFKYRLGDSRYLNFIRFWEIMGSHDQWEYPLLFRCHWPFLCSPGRVLTLWRLLHMLRHFDPSFSSLWKICIVSTGPFHPYIHGWPSTQPGSLHTALQR